MVEFAEELGTQLVRLQRLRERNIAQISSSGGVDGAAYVCLFRLLRDGPMRSSELATMVNSDPSTVSRQVAQLVERGHVERVPDERDGRAFVLAVTQSGRDVAAAIQQRRTESLGRVIEGWDREDRASLVALLDRFLTDYEEMRPDLPARRAGSV
ncbi:transcriptional regulator [Rhodococcus sp. 15-725-2-2b]|uniref:MarR family winged helix-turn-helix transcriptional regulator n=1 Tax=Nocardiaceae TaxID=85025 RepID=UPI00050CA0C2|nr:MULTISPECIES: MarR family transcriptional regulator [Rhodococcus]AJW42393.1 Transcriptional regulator, MarR [Rhodococcus sp. B7740]OZC68771.1 transcriptional regulator [Rhodococcus sp. 06-469-3-2]OZC74586.1 transcriptional regulator [Rhodococcus sp. 06-418-5]OZD47468.1 transcriptional regulator [Rhodococcus sp. 06-1477-1A]OZD84600.1 transcriptional regulator [Rhodococcus sp. 05-339-2]